MRYQYFIESVNYIRMAKIQALQQQVLLRIPSNSNSHSLPVGMQNSTVPSEDRASLVAQRLKRFPPMWETWVRSLGREDPLEKEMATHSSVLAWRIPWREGPLVGYIQSVWLQESGKQQQQHRRILSLGPEQGVPLSLHWFIHKMDCMLVVSSFHPVGRLLPITTA